MPKQRNIIVTSILTDIKKRFIEDAKIANNGTQNSLKVSTLGTLKVYELLNSGQSKEIDINVRRLEYGDRVCLERVVRGADGVDFLASENFDRWDEPKDWKIDVNEDEEVLEGMDDCELTPEQSQAFEKSGGKRFN